MRNLFEIQKIKTFKAQTKLHSTFNYTIGLIQLTILLKSIQLKNQLK